MEKIIKGLDVDDVIAGFYLAMCIKYNMPIKKRDIWCKTDCKFIGDNFNEVQSDYKFWLNLPVINTPGVINFDFDYYVSAFPEEMLKARQEWLHKNGFPDKPIICAHDKAEACISNNINVLIDDSKKNIDYVKDSGVIGIWYKPWYMIEQGQDIDNLSDVDRFLDRMK